jgi:hypothetical protein
MGHPASGNTEAHPFAKDAKGWGTHTRVGHPPVIANIAYCAAYIVDIFAQASGFREPWRRYRKILFVIGTLFATIITRFVAMGMFSRNR